MARQPSVSVHSSKGLLKGRKDVRKSLKISLGYERIARYMCFEGILGRKKMVRRCIEFRLQSGAETGFGSIEKGIKERRTCYGFFEEAFQLATNSN